MTSLLKSLPFEIETKIWNKYWESLYFKKVINELKNIKKIEKKLFEFINNKDFLIIKYSKLNDYKEINNLIKECLNNSSFKLLTKFNFFKNWRSSKIFDKFDETLKYVVEFMIYFSNYMSYKIYYEFLDLATQ